MLLASLGINSLIAEKFREKVEFLSLKISLFLFPLSFLSLFPSLFPIQSGWESFGQEDLSSHATCQILSGSWDYILSSYPLTLDFPPMTLCHVSTHDPHLSSCLTNSAHDTWHFLSHSKCVKCLALPLCLEKYENFNCLEIRRNSTW